METKSLNSFEKALGSAIARRRLQLCFTQAKLAKLAGIHLTYVSEIERGKRNITVAVFYQIARSLELSGVQLLEEAEQCLNSEC
ncbi:MAG: helix-turn-helix transcriptional regulator [Candidatus Obscuribacterales bacterium]|nr:helix-turn-helix transcriptional regulator [Candidatus Obscuribacterales bacterium]